METEIVNDMCMIGSCDIVPEGSLSLRIGLTRGGGDGKNVKNEIKHRNE